MRKLSFIRGSFTVASINIFVGIVGILYQIALSKRIGAEGVGLFHYASAALTPFLIVTTAGIPMAVSRLVAENYTRNASNNSRRVFETAVGFVLVLSVCLGLILIALNGMIASILFANDSLRPCLYLAAPSIVVISLSSVFRGYLYGLRLMAAAGASELIEHLMRFILVIGFLTLSRPLSPLHGAEIAVCGIFIGELADLLWLVCTEKRVSDRLPITGTPQAHPKILGALLDIAGPLTLTGLSSTLMQSANAVLIPQRLMTAGMTASIAAAEYGRLSGMVQPLLFLPFTITSALVINLIPNLSAQYAAKSLLRARKTAMQAMVLTLLASVPLTIVYVSLASPIGNIVYHDEKVHELILLMSGATVPLALQHTFSGILSGIGRQSHATLHRMAGLAIQLGAAYCLVGDSRFGINGYAVSFYLYVIFVCVMDFRSISLGLTTVTSMRKQIKTEYSS